jgi:hypothetical protein
MSIQTKTLMLNIEQLSLRSVIRIWPTFIDDLTVSSASTIPHTRGRIKK